MFGQSRHLLWDISPDESIRWNVEKAQAHSDHIEMSGLNVSAILTYGVDESGQLINTKSLIFPMLRTVPNNTHASLHQDFDGEEQPIIHVDGVRVKEFPVTFNLKGILNIASRTNTGISIERSIFPSRIRLLALSGSSFKTRPEKAVMSRSISRLLR